MPRELDLDAALRAALVVLVLATFPSVIWFFVMRRRMVRRIAYVARALEGVLRPRDQRYWYLGYLVGFRARYWVSRRGVSKVAALYSIPPVHVFFYLPVIALLRRRERLELAVEVRRPQLGGEAHVVDESSRLAVASLKRDVGERRLKGMTRGVLGGRVAVYRSGDSGAEKLAVELARRLSAYGRVLRVTVDSGRRLVYASLDLKPEARVEEVVENVLSAAERLAGGREAPSREAGDGG